MQAIQASWLVQSQVQYKKMTFGMDLQDEKTRKGSWTRDEDMLLYSCLARVYIARASGNITKEEMQTKTDSCYLYWW